MHYCFNTISVCPHTIYCFCHAIFHSDLTIIHFYRHLIQLFSPLFFFIYDLLLVLWCNLSFSFFPQMPLLSFWISLIFKKLLFTYFLFYVLLLLLLFYLHTPWFPLWQPIAEFVINLALLTTLFVFLQPSIILVYPPFILFYPILLFFHNLFVSLPSSTLLLHHHHSPIHSPWHK